MGCNIELTSITNAMKARDLLRKNRFTVTVEKITGNTSAGCAYNVVVERDCDRATKLLNQAGIRIRGIS